MMKKWRKNKRYTAGAGVWTRHLSFESDGAYRLGKGDSESCAALDIYMWQSQVENEHN